jgi:pSer/pThr/pTyr-binding forkhead associated (FHA) protein
LNYQQLHFPYQVKEKLMPTVKLIFKNKSLGDYPIGAGDTLLIGRNNVNDIVIDNLAVSAQHARIESIGNEFLYVDLKSENGSFVNDQQIKSHWLNDGDVITVGKHTLQFSNPENNLDEKIRNFGSTKTMKIDTKRFRELMEMSKSQENSGSNTNKNFSRSVREQIAILSYLTGKKEKIQLKDPMVRIGKDPNSDVLISGFGVGKTAAVLNLSPDGWHIRFVEGLFKPRINNKPLKGSVKLNNLDIIKIGSTKLQFLILRSLAIK